MVGPPVYEQTFGSRATISEVQTRAVFYPGSSFEISGGLSAAIDPTRTALLPGQSTSNANYTNYARGLNGLVVDISNSGTPTASDFAFATWNGSSLGGFTTLAVQPTVTVLPGVGKNGSTRVRLQFPDQSITNTWLRVTVLANANTGLSANDVFYFGNAIGDFSVGNIGTPLTVRTNATDTGTVRQLSNQSPNPNSVPVTNLFDINKDGRVNATDIGLVRQNQNPGSLTYFTAPVALVLFAEDNFAAPPITTLASVSAREKEASRLESQVLSSAIKSPKPISLTIPSNLNELRQGFPSRNPVDSNPSPTNSRAVDAVFASSFEKLERIIA